MFIAMNRFQVVPERAADFEHAWQTRDSYLDQVPGFQAFALLKGDLPGEYISHSQWESRAAFEAWTRSEHFKRAHASGIGEGILADHPHASFYEAVLVTPAEVPAATPR